MIKQTYKRIKTAELERLSNVRNALPNSARSFGKSVYQTDKSIAVLTATLMNGPLSRH
jgi:hypothetical protein